jgi:hypothetical protein
MTAAKKGSWSKLPGVLVPGENGKPARRSAVTSGRRRFLQEGIGDGNSPWSRRVRDIARAHIADLGGEKNCSQAQISLCQRAGTLATEIERLEALLSIGEKVDVDLLGRLIGHLRRCYEVLGLERKPKVVVPSLKEYISANYTKEQD